jgi:hypothetical protein
MALSVTDLKQLMLDVSKTAVEVFDRLEKLDPLDLQTVLLVRDMGDKVEEYMAYVWTHNTLRLRDLGVDLSKMPGYYDGVRRFLGEEFVPDEER